jgi:DnaJ-like protein
VGVDPHAVLGLEPGASSDEIQRAYRDLAKRFHPDRAGTQAGEMMISINAAYDMLRDQLTAGAKAGPPPARAAEPSPARRRHGDWLAPEVRRVLARELLAALEDGEQVRDVVLTATGDSHDVQLAVTDRRLLWLRDDAIVGRVRYVRFRDVAHVDGRRGGRWRRRGELRVVATSGRRLRFFDLRPELVARLTQRIAAASQAAARRPG